MSKIEFSRGYSDVRKRVEKGSRYTMSCYNCDFFSQEMGDDTEMCQNSEVLQFDMIVTETSIFCNRWRISHRETKSENSLFKRGGKSLNERKKEISKTRKTSGKRDKR